jgi:hypothetical protein
VALGGGEGLGTATERIGRIRHLGLTPEAEHGWSLAAEPPARRSQDWMLS